MGCTTEKRLDKLLKKDVIGEAKSFRDEGNKVFIPFGENLKIKTKKAAYEVAIGKVNKLNTLYSKFSKGDIASLGTERDNGYYVNIHPTKELISEFDYKINKEDAEKTEKELLQQGLLYSDYNVYRLNKPENPVSEEDFNNLTEEERKMLIYQTFNC